MKFKLLKKEFIFDNCNDCGDLSINSVVVFKFEDCAFKTILCKECIQKKIRELISGGNKMLKIEKTIEVLSQIYRLHEHWSKSYDANEMYIALGYVKPEDWLQALSHALTILKRLPSEEEIRDITIDWIQQNRKGIIKLQVGKSCASYAKRLAHAIFKRIGKGEVKMKYIRVTMPDLSKWDIPADFIAKARAMYYADKEGTNSKNWNKIFNEEYKYTMKDDYELKDWLSNNMNWDEIIEDIAEKVSEVKLANEDLQEGIINGEKEIIEK